MRLLGFDVGVVHLAFVVVNVSDDWFQYDRPDPACVTVEQVRRVDLCQPVHRRVPRAQCRLHHSREMTDRVAHFLQEYELDWDVESLDRVLIERQPLGGLVHVESLLFSHFRERAQKISPNRLHKWLGFHGLNYDQRKVAVVAHARPFLGHLRHYWYLERQHDMADALLVCLFYLWGCKRELGRLRCEHYFLQARPGEGALDTFLSRFRFHKGEQRHNAEACAAGTAVQRSVNAVATAPLPCTPPPSALTKPTQSSLPTHHV